MPLRENPTPEEIKVWLEALDVDFFLCDHCHGLHLSVLQDQPGVLDARLFVDEGALLLTTELEIKPSLAAYVQADLARLSMSYSLLKFFVDFQDEMPPRLVICDTQLTGAGITEQQFAVFLEMIIGMTAAVVDECNAQDWLVVQDELENLMYDEQTGHGLH